MNTFQRKMRFSEKTKLTFESNEKVKEKIIMLDSNIKNNKNISLKTPNMRIYKSSLHKNNSRYAYATMIIFDEKYMPSILNLGMTLRLYKSEHKLICLVQDKTYINKFNGNKLMGVSQDCIYDLLKIFDEVIGIDLINVNNYEIPNDHFTNGITYTNIYYYCTKLVLLGLTQYEKIMYLDGSTIIQKNIDYIFYKYKKSAFVDDNEWRRGNVGLKGTYFFIVPNLYEYNKGLIFLEDYQKYFGKNYFIRGVDEIIIYYAVFPNWSEELLDTGLGCNGNLTNNLYENCEIYYYQTHKPFRPVDDNVPKDTINKRYILWDTNAKNLLEKYPEFFKYFEHITEFRDFQI